MNDMLIYRRAEIEAEAKLRGVHSELLAAQVEQIIARVQNRALRVHQPSESYGLTETSPWRQKDCIPRVMEITPLSV
jgi:hypothetical protein